MNKQNKQVFFQDGCEDLTRLSQKMALFSSMLAKGYNLRLRVTGTSMSPFLKTGTIVTLFKIPFGKLNIGDIIFCRHDEGSMKLHRLIAIKKNRLITKGDAVDSLDHPVDETQYLGKVVRIEGQRSNIVWSRNMETTLYQIINYIFAVYYRYKSLLICKLVNLKSHLRNNRLLIFKNH